MSRTWWRALLLCVASAGPLWLAVSTPVLAQRPDSRQVTMFGILATPGSTSVDPKLSTLAPQLRKLMPNHGFTLLEVQSKRLSPGKKVACQKLNGYSAEATLMDVLDVNGKVDLRFALGAAGQMQSATIVSTPPNQLFFFDKPLSDGSRLLIGIGAR